MATDNYYSMCAKDLTCTDTTDAEMLIPEPEDSKFMKNDNGKVLASLVDPDFILGTAEILTFGAKKYAKNNWQLNDDLDRYKDALLRHLYSYLGGELIDPESGKPHLDHIACNIMFIRYFEHGKGSTIKGD